MRIAFCVMLIALAPGCARRNLHSSNPRPLERATWDSPGIDLQPGWRLSVVTPLLKSGGYKLGAAEKSDEGNSLTLRAGDEFEGFETSTYAVEPKAGGGVQIAFVKAEATRNGQTAPQPNAVMPLFRLPPNARFVRLLYLKRVSEADHDMAVAAAGNMGALESLTAAVEASQSACKTDSQAFCEWVPPGIAVRPEARTPGSGAGQWNPVR